MFKHANRGALPAMLVLGVLIGASLAVASPSRPNRVLPSASPPVVATPVVPGDDGGTAGSDGAAEPHACAHAIAVLAHENHALSHAIARVLTKCKDNPQAPGLVNALLHRRGNAAEGGGESSHAGPAGGQGGRGGSGSESDGSGGSGSGASEGSGGGDPGAGGSDGGGSIGSGSTGGDEKYNSGKARGHFDGKGKNG